MKYKARRMIRLVLLFETRILPPGHRADPVYIPCLWLRDSTCCWGARNHSLMRVAPVYPAQCYHFTLVRCTSHSGMMVEVSGYSRIDEVLFEKMCHRLYLGKCLKLLSPTVSVPHRRRPALLLRGLGAKYPGTRRGYSGHTSVRTKSLCAK